MPKILIIDDEKAFRTLLKDILEFEKHEVEVAEDGKEGFEMIQNQDYDLVICNMSMPKMHGMEVLEKSMALEKYKNTSFIMTSVHTPTKIVVETIKKGAFDFIQKPPDLNRLLLSIADALKQHTL